MLGLSGIRSMAMQGNRKRAVTFFLKKKMKLEYLLTGQAESYGIGEGEMQIL